MELVTQVGRDRQPRPHVGVRRLRLRLLPRHTRIVGQPVVRGERLRFPGADLLPAGRRGRRRRAVIIVSSSIGSGTKTGPGTTLLSLGLALLAGCEPGQAPGEAPANAGFVDVFAFEGIVELGEDAADSIAQPGAFVERRRGGFVLADRLLPRIRTYSEDGRLEAAFGRFGVRNPWSFERVGGVAETAAGGVVAVEYTKKRLLYLTDALERDTVVPISGHPWDAVALGPDLLLEMQVGEWEAVRADRLPFFHRVVGDQVAWSRYSFPYVPSERPYWDSFAAFLGTAAGDSVFATTSLGYPVVVYNGAGDSVGTIGTPSTSFRPIPVLELGALVDQGPGGGLVDFLASFDMIHGIDVVADSYLVVTLGVLDPTKPFPPFKWLNTSVDVYDRHTGAKLYEDVSLPDGSEVLGGGRFLYLLTNREEPPWRAAKLRLRIS